MENLSLSAKEDDELVIGEIGAGSQDGDINLCIVGRFLTDQALNFNFTRSRLASV